MWACDSILATKMPLETAGRTFKGQVPYNWERKLVCAPFASPSSLTTHLKTDMIARALKALLDHEVLLCTATL